MLVLDGRPDVIYKRTAAFVPSLLSQTEKIK